jgi:hypothetical protein
VDVEEEEKEEDADVEEDDVEEEDRSRDQEAHFVRACAIEMHMDIAPGKSGRRQKSLKETTASRVSQSKYRSHELEKGNQSTTTDQPPSVR